MVERLNTHTIVASLRLPVHISNEYNCVLTVQPGQRSAALTCYTRQGKLMVVCHGQPSEFRYHVSLVTLSPGRHSRWSCANLSVSHRTETALRFQHDLIYITSIGMTRWLRRRWYDCFYARVNLDPCALQRIEATLGDAIGDSTSNQASVQDPATGSRCDLRRHPRRIHRHTFVRLYAVIHYTRRLGIPHRPYGTAANPC